ncbi:MAG: hypothetical protein ACYC7D_12270 [Nitrososphaerales archaeon]
MLSRHHFTVKDAESYGIGLAFWENGVFLAVPVLLDYIVYYAILFSPNSSAAQVLFPSLVKVSPSLFYGVAQALPLIGYSILERVAFLTAHFSWGYLAVLSAV